MNQKHPSAVRRHSGTKSHGNQRGRTNLASQPHTKREARLLRELEKVRRENLRLRGKIESMQREKAATETPSIPLRKKPTRAEDAWKNQYYEQCNIAHCLSQTSYPGFLRSYLRDTLGTSLPIRLLRKVTLLFRRIRLVRLILAIAVMLSATVLLIPLYVVVLPGMLILTALTAFFSLFFATRMNRRLQEQLAGKHLYVFVATDEACFSADAFFRQNALSIASDSRCAVLVVSPHNVSPAGLGGKGFYFTARQEDERLFIVRRHYYFNLRRRVLNELDAHITVVC